VVGHLVCLKGLNCLHRKARWMTWDWPCSDVVPKLCVVHAASFCEVCEASGVPRRAWPCTEFFMQCTYYACFSFTADYKCTAKLDHWWLHACGMPCPVDHHYSRKGGPATEWNGSQIVQTNKMDHTFCMSVWFTGAARLQGRLQDLGVCRKYPRCCLQILKIWNGLLALFVWDWLALHVPYDVHKNIVYTLINEVSYVTYPLCLAPVCERCLYLSVPF